MVRKESIPCRKNIIFHSLCFRTLSQSDRGLKLYLRVYWHQIFIHTTTRPQDNYGNSDIVNLFQVKKSMWYFGSLLKDINFHDFDKSIEIFLSENPTHLGFFKKNWNPSGNEKISGKN